MTHGKLSGRRGQRQRGSEAERERERERETGRGGRDDVRLGELLETHG